MSGNGVISLIENIKSGSYATVRHFSLELPCIGLIDTISGNLLNVLIKDIPIQMAEGDPVVLTFADKANTLVVDCTIKSITNSNLLILIADEVMSYSEGRKNIRYFSSFAGSVTFDGKTDFAGFKDISVDGCLIVTGINLIEGNEILLNLIPDQLTSLDFKAIVKRSRKINDLVFEYGLQITYISNSNYSKLTNVFKDLDKIVEEELSALKILSMKGGN